MIRCCALSLLFASLAVADTKVAVLEFGSRGAVQRSASSSEAASVGGVQTFWASLHDSRRALVSKEIPLVSDLFNKPDGGIVVSLTGADLSAMPGASSILGEAVGVIQVPGSQGRALLQNVAVSSTWKEAVASALTTSTLQAVEIHADDASAADAELSRMVTSLKEEAVTRGKSLVLHLVVADSSSHRQLEERVLANDGGNDDGTTLATYYSNGFYGYGYTDSSGNFVVVSKTIFQIQFFQIVLWTAIGLVIAMVFCFSLMANMPLMADTLLFGESSKMMGD